MTRSGDNIVTTIDKLLKAYAPALGRWMEENPEFHGINTFIGKDSALCALPADENDMGYRDKAFDMISRPVLTDLEPVLAEITGSSKMLGKTDSLSVWARRQDGRITISAAATSSLGTVFVKRNANKLPGADVYAYDPCTIFATAIVRDKKTAADLKKLSGNEMGEVIEFMITNDVALNLKGTSSSYLRKWIKAFPKPEAVVIQHVSGPAYHAIAESQQDYHKVLSDEAFFEKKIRGTELEGKLPIDVFQTDAPENILRP